MVTPIELRTSDLALSDGKHVVLLTFIGDLDESNIDDIAKQVYAALDSAGEKATILLDFSELGYLNSKSIGYLSDWYTKLTERSGSLAVGGVKENVLDILQTVGLDNFIKLFPSMEDAKVYLAGGKQPAKSKPAEDKPASAGITLS